MKQNFFEEKRYFRDIMLVLGILTGFIFIVTYTSLHVSNEINNGNACGCVLPIPIMIVALSSLGLFVGIFTYYFITLGHIKKRKEITQDIELTLNFLENDERTIIKTLIDNDLGLKQKKIEDITGLNKVRIHRVIQKLVNKNLIKKISDGKTNMIELEDNLSKLFNR